MCPEVEDAAAGARPRAAPSGRGPRAATSGGDAAGRASESRSSSPAPRSQAVGGAAGAAPRGARGRAGRRSGVPARPQESAAAVRTRRAPACGTWRTRAEPACPRGRRGCAGTRRCAARAPSRRPRRRGERGRSRRPRASSRGRRRSRARTNGRRSPAAPGSHGSADQAASEEERGRWPRRRPGRARTSRRGSRRAWAARSPGCLVPPARLAALEQQMAQHAPGRAQVELDEQRQQPVDHVRALAPGRRAEAVGAEQVERAPDQLEVEAQREGRRAASRSPLTPRPLRATASSMFEGPAQGARAGRGVHALPGLQEVQGRDGARRSTQLRGPQ